MTNSKKNIITNSDDPKSVYEYGNIYFPVKEVCYHHKCRLEFTYQVSKSKSQETAILDDAYTNIFSFLWTHVIDEYYNTTNKKHIKIKEQILRKTWCLWGTKTTGY